MRAIVMFRLLLAISLLGLALGIRQQRHALGRAAQRVGQAAHSQGALGVPWACPCWVRCPTGGGRGGAWQRC